MNMFDSIIEKFNVGTPNYMSPETLVYNNYSEKSDIWALGVLFYEMLHGELPYKGANIEHLLHLMTNQQVQCGR